MKDMITVTIDGKDIQVAEGMNIIDAAEVAGVHIPNLCYLKGMKGMGACRMCLVEVEGLKAPVIACNTKIKDGMRVRTKTDKIQEVRKFVIDLLLSMHPLDCMTCTKAGVCNLQQYAYEFDLKESSFRRKKSGYPTDEANPFIKRDPEYCVLCGRCVRVCREQGTNVLEFMGRGIESKVITAGDRPLQESGCTFCGSCVDACPVNALLESDRWRKGREWEYEKTDSVCLLCGSACVIQVSTKDGRIQRISIHAPEGSVERYLCAYGRFGFDSVAAHTRVNAPMKRVNGQLQETTWEDALEVVSTALRHDPAKVGFIGSAGLMNEDALALRKFAGDIVRTENVDSTVSLYANADYFLMSQRADIDEADVIVVVGLNPSQWERVLPALDASVRKRVDRGAHLIVLSESASRLGEVASVNLTGNVTSILSRLAKALMGKGLKGNRNIGSAVHHVEVTEAINKAATLIAEAKQPVIFSSPAFFGASSNVALLKGKIIAVPPECNAKGVSLMGLVPGGMSSYDMIHGGTEVLYVVGEVPFFDRPDTAFLVVQNAHFTSLAKQADVVLPSGSFFELSGTIVDFMGRLKKVNKVIELHDKSMSHRDIFVSLAGKLGSRMKNPTEVEVTRASRTRMKIKGGSFQKYERFDIPYDQFIESITSSVVNSSRLVWLKDAMEQSLKT